MSGRVIPFSPDAAIPPYGADSAAACSEPAAASFPALGSQPGLFNALFDPNAFEAAIDHEPYNAILAAVTEALNG
jgi:hypothetical protein